ncbi:MAG: peptidyl-alpha-hydroxyglycine alpha-amidating lyase family protein [Verrucomicrobia bacterium]|nr:peptidyl-alpha-hydroxyglycine alpha-amidating lyase family protein [Verrucomicrobiota bacterium]
MLRTILLSLLITPFIAAADDYQVVHGWPKVPEGFVLGQVSGVDLDSHGNVFVFRRAEHLWLGDRAATELIKSPTVLLFDAKSGALLAQWGENFFLCPHGLTIDAEDNLWLTDVELHQVFKFTHDGKLLMTLGEHAKAGTDSKHFNKPTDVAVAPDGTFYVSDGYGNSRIMKFSKEGKFIAQWGTRGDGAGEFHTPHGLAMENDGKIYVADRGNARIQIFDGDGKHLGTWKDKSIGRPWAICAATDGFFYIVDGGDQPGHPIASVPDRARILKVDATGSVVASFGSFGNYDGQFFWPHDIAVGRDGSVYVVDITGMRVQKFLPRK